MLVHFFFWSCWLNRWVEWILNRYNVFTKRRYKDDPSIASIELINEGVYDPSSSSDRFTASASLMSIIFQNNCAVCSKVPKRLLWWSSRWMAQNNEWYDVAFLSGSIDDANLRLSWNLCPLLLLEVVRYHDGNKHMVSTGSEGEIQATVHTMIT